MGEPTDYETLLGNWHTNLKSKIGRPMDHTAWFEWHSFHMGWF